ncbi:MAG: hypothetical protein ACI846_000115 [Pseudoalteromonas distincta]|jgi:hypothetical protein
MKVNKMIPGESYNTTVLRENVNAIIDYNYTAVKQRFLDALLSNTPYTYIVSGDSTRNSGELDSSTYYDPQLKKINFNLVMNSSGGQSAKNWSQNLGNSTLQEAIDATEGTGSTTILEMSLGINQGERTAEEVKVHIINGLNNYLSVKPDVLIIFVSPNETGTPKNDDLDAMYSELPLEFENSVYISGKKATTHVHQNDDFYLDFTHLNFNGLRRLVNYIFNAALPIECKQYMSVEDTPKASAPSSLPFTVQNGNWYRGGNDILRFDSSRTDRRATTLIEVEPNFIVKLDTGGDNSSFYFADDDGNIVEAGYASYHDGASGAFRSVVVPLGASKLAYSFSNNGSEWDASGKVPVVEYLVTETAYMNQQRLNYGNLLSLPYVPNPSIDASGKLPTAGQVQQGQSDGSWLWV